MDTNGALLGRGIPQLGQWLTQLRNSLYFHGLNTYKVIKKLYLNGKKYLLSVWYFFKVIG